MLDRSASTGLPADSAPAESLPAESLPAESLAAESLAADTSAAPESVSSESPVVSAGAETFVPFKDRDFRAVSRQTAAKSIPPQSEPQQPVPQSGEAAPEVPVDEPLDVTEPTVVQTEAPVVDEAPVADEAQAESSGMETTPEVPMQTEWIQSDVLQADVIQTEWMQTDVVGLPDPASSATTAVPETDDPPHPADEVSTPKADDNPAPTKHAEIHVELRPPAADPAPTVETPAMEEAPATSNSGPSLSTQQPASPTSQAEQTEEPAVENGFLHLGLNEFVLKSVIDGGYEQPTQIQAEIIPHVLEGRDVLAQSQTGSGKTAAFALPILSRIETGKNASRKPQVLVLAPTRELAIQVAGSFSTYGAFLPGFTVTTIYGGQSYDSQFRQLKRGINVVVGTPGRVIDHVKRGTLDLSELGCLVLDEADEMLNMGFLDDVRFILDHTPDHRQVALFSATLPAPIRAIAEEHLHDPARVTIKRKTMTADSIRQRALFVPARNKIEALKRVLEAEDTDGVIIFTKTKDATVNVAEQLQQEGLATVALNGDMPQKVRERTIEQLKKGQLDILVATDVAARGLDVTRVSHVINYDPPQDNESYIHRVGRTGRAGRKGEAIILLSKSQRGRLRQIERATKQTIEVIDLPTADDINQARTKRFLQRIAQTVAEEDVTLFEEMIEQFAEESQTPMAKIAAALAHLGQQGRPFLVEDLPQRRRERRDFDDDRQSHSRFGHHDDDSRRGRGDRRPRRTDSSSDPVEPGMDRYRIAVGWQDGVKPGNIVGAVANEGGIDGDAIGAIRIYSSWSTIDLPEGMPNHVREALQTTRVAGRPLQLRPYTDEPDMSRKRPQRFGDKPRGKKPFSGRRGGKPGKRPFGRKQGAAGKPGGKPTKHHRRSKSS